MSTTTAQNVKNHIDGGTYRVLALAGTSRRWAIAVTEWTTYKGEVVFQAHRVSPANVMLALGTYTTESAAREAANRAWRRDR